MTTRNSISTPAEGQHYIPEISTSQPSLSNGAVQSAAFTHNNFNVTPESTITSLCEMNELQTTDFECHGRNNGSRYTEVRNSVSKASEYASASIESYDGCAHSHRSQKSGLRRE